MQHTKTPWSLFVNDSGDIATGWPSIHCEDDGRGNDPVIVFSQGFSVNDYTFSYVSKMEAVANAKFIVRACNAHDVLVKALREIADGCISRRPGHVDAGKNRSKAEIEDIARAALKLAGEA